MQLWGRLFMMSAATQEQPCEKHYDGKARDAAYNSAYYGAYRCRFGGGFGSGSG